MTTLQTAAQQALEALELLQNAIYNIGGEHVTGLGYANHAADSAEKPITGLKAALAEPVEEPVAWRFQFAVGGWAYGSQPPLGSKYPAYPLYATPPQRKPLTEEDLRKLADKHLFYQLESYEVSGVFALARAVEQAHGIKE
jgi:hypothetical protein